MADRVRTIRWTRSGGFVGAVRSGEVDLSTLPAAEAKELEQLVAEVDFPSPAADAASSLPGAAPSADRFHYAITVETDQGRRELQIREADAPPPLKSLIARLMQLGRRPL
jgi:hypothetical protein